MFDDGNTKSSSFLIQCWLIVCSLKNVAKIRQHGDPKNIASWYMLKFMLNLAVLWPLITHPLVTDNSSKILEICGYLWRAYLYYLALSQWSVTISETPPLIWTVQSSRVRSNKIIGHDSWLLSGNLIRTLAQNEYIWK